MMTCSAPADCAEIERRRSTGIGLLADGGASRGNLLSGDADEVILTVSRMEAEKQANPGYRAFLANGFNVTRALALFVWEVVLEWTAAIRAIRRDVRPRGHRGGYLPVPARGDVRDRPRPDRLRRAHRHDARPPRGLRDLLLLRRGRPPLGPRARRHDGGAAQARPAVRPDRGGARSYAPRPYEIVVLSDHGQTQGATFKQRNGYGLDELVERSLAGGRGHRVRRRRRADARWSATRSRRPPAATPEKRPKNDVSDREAVVLGSGNLGLIYLMEEPRRLTLEEIDERHPKLLAALRDASARRLAAGPLGRARAARPRRARASCDSPTGRSRATTRSRPSRRPPPSTCCAPTASSTSPTSWSAASTTPSSTRAARSRS